MKKYPLFLALLCVFTNLFAQKLEYETTYEFESLRKNCYLGEVTVNQDNDELSLHYVQKQPAKTIFYSYHFNDNLKFVEETQEEYDAADELKLLGNDLKNSFNWCSNKYKGETFTENRLHVYPGMGGKIIIKKYEYTFVGP